MPSLLDMPDVAMNLILQKLDFQSIQCLRKSCRDLRNYIDDVKPELKLDALEIQLYEDHIRLDLSDLDLMCYRHILYQDARDYVDVACKNVQSLLDLQTSGVLKTLRIEVFRAYQDARQFLDKFQKYLQSRSHSLNVSNVKSCIFNLESTVHFLPFVTPSKLKSIEIRGQSPNSNQGFRFPELFQLEQWKCSKEVIFHPFEVDNYLENFLHFESATIKFNVLSMEVVLNLKETILRSSHMNYFEIYYNRFHDRLSEMFGEPRYETDELHWFFKILNDADNVVTIILKEIKSIIIRRINREYVPEGVVFH